MSNLAKATIGLMVVTVVSKLLGFSRELVLASSYGTTTYSDAYLISISIPVTLFAIIGRGISTTFIPIYYELSKNERDKFVNNIINIVLILTSVMSIIGILFSEQIINIFAMGFTGEKLETTIYFTRVTLVGIIFIGLSSIMTSLLHIYNKFSLSGLSGVPFNLIIIIFIILSSKFNPLILPYGSLLALSSQFVFLLYIASKNGYRYKMYIDLKAKYVKKMIRLIGPVCIGVGVNQLNIMIDRSISSTLGDGTIAALNYANRLNGFVMGLFIASISSVVYPILSKLSSENNKQKFNNIITKSINIIILLVIPISIGAIVLAEPIVSVLFKRGLFDEKATRLTAIALVFYSIGMIGVGLRDVLGKVFYSIKDTKIPMKNGIIAMVINIVLNLILSKFMGHAGIAFATSLSSILCILLLFKNLKQKIGNFGQDKIIKTTIKSVISGILMGIISLVSYNIIIKFLGKGFVGDFISLFGAIGIGFIVYISLILILGVEEVSTMINFLLGKLKKVKILFKVESLR